jgi:hypothetical protein
MVTFRFALVSLFIVFSLTVAPTPASADGPLPARGHLTVTGKISLPDGSPAADATVSSSARNGAGETVETTTVQADRLGRFELTGEFGWGCILRAASADGAFQTIWRVSGILARTRLAEPVELKLLPAREITVSVVSAGKPVEGAQLIANGSEYSLLAVTRSDGSAVIRLPPDAKLWSLVAWHPTLGAAIKDNQRVEFSDVGYSLNAPAFQLALLDPTLRTLHVTDIDGNSIPNLKLALSVFVKSTGWLATEKIERAHITTDEHGEAKVPWFPKENAKNFDVQVIGADWTVVPPANEFGEPEEVPREGPIEIRVQRRRPARIEVPGRVKLPKGTQAAGILLGRPPFWARTRADGSFTLALVPGRAYALNIGDPEWASDGWTGVIQKDDGAAPPEIILEAYPATPLEIRVSSGADRRPVAGSGLTLEPQREFRWRDEQGKKQVIRGGWFGGLQTDHTGVVRVGVGKGKHKIRLGASTWHEERIVEVDEDSPKVIEFHRRWSGARKIVGRLLRSGSPHRPSPAAIVRAEANNESERWRRLAVESQIRADGTFELEADAEQFSLLVIEPSERLSGFVRLGAASDTVDLPLFPAATFAGTVLDGHGKPLSGAALQLIVWNTRLVVDEEQSDDAGQFRFDIVPADVELEFNIRRQPDGPVIDHYRPRPFLPGEVRDHIRVTVESNDSPTEQAEQPSIAKRSLADRLAGTTRMVRAAGMRLLVVLQGDDSPRVANLTKEILDDDWRDDEPPPILGYLPLVVAANSTESESATIKQLGWQRPASHEVVLIATDGKGDVIATQRIDADNNAAAEQAAQFVKHNRPAIRDARELLDAARKNASRTGRRVWIVLSGPRCGPCFSLARWMDDQHELLEKDYVIVKFLGGLDEHFAEVKKVLNPRNDGIPWFAIAEPDGTVIVTSDGPLGNVGFFANSREGTRHLRDMLGRTARRLTADDIDRLAQSVSEVDQ